jgi:4'-phosphopantetheinyl transferase EntD
MAPPDVAVTAALIDSQWMCELFDEERTTMINAGTTRLRDFATGRHCARRALFDLGVPAVAIRSGHRGQPLWPAGHVGSISHGAGVCVAIAAVGRPGLRSIGIDVERVGSLDESLWPSVMGPKEQSMCHQAANAAAAATIVFSGKEALFKAQYPVAGAELGFLDVELDRLPTGTTPATGRVLDHVAPVPGTGGDSLGQVHVCVVGDVVVSVAVID